MREFFKSWRRKAGVVSLVMACTLLVAWMRTAVTVDIIRLSRQEAIISGDGHFVIYLVRRNASPMEWYQWHMRNDERFGPWEKVSRGTFGGIEFGTDVIVDKSTQIEMDRANWWRVPYWELILPLTPLSAYLILWKPSKRMGPEHA